MARDLELFPDRREDWVSYSLDFSGGYEMADKWHQVTEAARVAAREAEARLTAASPQDKFFGVWRAALDAAANASHRLGDVAEAGITQIADEVSAHLKPNQL